MEKGSIKMLDFFKKKYNVNVIIPIIEPRVPLYYTGFFKNIMRSILYTFSFLLLLITFLGAPVPVRANTPSLTMEVQTAIKIIGFIQGVKASSNNEINIKIVFDPESVDSKLSATKIQEIINSAPSIRKKRIISNLSSINTPLEPSQIYIIAPNTSRGYNVIKKHSLQNKSVAISIGSDCARRNICGLAVEKKQAIKIYLNESIFDLSAYDLDSTLRYLAVKL